MKRRWLDLALAVGLVALTIAAYYQVADHDWVGYDDAIYVTQNPHVKQGLTWESFLWAWTQPRAANWHPLTMLSHIVDYEIYENWAGGHYLTNLAFHLIDVVLLFLVVRWLVRSGEIAAGHEPGNRLSDASLSWRAAFVAAMFAVHPLHVESVAWVAERKDVLSTMFFLLALQAYGWYVRRPTALRMTLVALSMALGLLAKPMLVTLPFVLLLLDYWPLRRFTATPGGWKRLALYRVLEKLPLFALSIASSVVTYYVQNSTGAMRTLRHVGFDDRLANALMAYAGYLGKMFWPLRLTCLYPLPGRYLLMRPEYLTKTILAALLLAAVTISVVWLRRRCPYLVVGWFWFVGTLVPVIGLVQVGSQAMADRYTYIPLIGLFLAAAWGVPALLARAPGRREVLVVAGAAIVIACTALTWRQVQVWENNLTLWQHSIDTIGDTAAGHCGVATPLADAGKLEAAYQHCLKALELEPNDPFAHHCTGAILAKMERYEEAIKHYDRSVKLDPRNHVAWAGRASVHTQLKQNEKAVDDYRRAIAVEPAEPSYHYELANLLVKMERHPLAEDEYLQVLRYDPRNVDALASLGNLLVRRKVPKRAIEYYQRVLELSPQSDVIRANLAYLLFEHGALEESAHQYDELIRRAPNSANYLIERARLAMRAGDTAKALECYRAAVRLQPASTTYHVELAKAILEAHRRHQPADLDEAVEACRVALAIDPDMADAYYYLALLHEAQGALPAAATAYEHVLRLSPDRHEAANNLAWLWATDPSTEERHVLRAVELAEEVCRATERNQPFYLDTLAVAYARAGRFDDAIETAREAVELATAAENHAIANEIRERLKLYEAGKPYSAG